MVRNLASASAGARVISFSSETVGCEASNILNDNLSKIWLTQAKLPEYVCIGFIAATDHTKTLAIQTIGWHCWHAYTTNPRRVTLHVSADARKFKQWATFNCDPEAGNHLFGCAPITIGIYPYIALEVNDSFGGAQTYMNRLYLFAEAVDELPKPLTAISSLSISEANTSELYRQLEDALGPESDEHEEEQGPLEALSRSQQSLGTSAKERLVAVHSQAGNAGPETALEVRLRELEKQIRSLQAIVVHRPPPVESMHTAGTIHLEDKEVGSSEEDSIEANHHDNAKSVPDADALSIATLSSAGVWWTTSLNAELTMQGGENNNHDQTHHTTDVLNPSNNRASKTDDHTSKPADGDLERLKGTMSELRTMMTKLQNRTASNTPQTTPTAAGKYLQQLPSPLPLSSTTGHPKSAKASALSPPSIVLASGRLADNQGELEGSDVDLDDSYRPKAQPGMQTPRLDDHNGSSIKIQPVEDQHESLLRLEPAARTTTCSDKARNPTSWPDHPMKRDEAVQTSTLHLTSNDELFRSGVPSVVAGMKPPTPWATKKFSRSTLPDTTVQTHADPAAVSHYKAPESIVSLIQELHAKVLERSLQAAKLRWLRRAHLQNR